MSDSESSVDAPRIITEKKRKRSKDVASEDELEIDVNLPEPASKRAKRKEKKASSKKPKKTSDKPGDEDANPDLKDVAPDRARANFDSTAAQTRSDHGIWIGNLPFTATREQIRDFLSREGGIEEKEVVRLHLPGPTKKPAAAASGRNAEQQNRGFAYIDFTSKGLVDRAIGLSEKLIGGRRVLIKDAKNFEGRPQVQQPREGQSKVVKEPSKRVFVGNLGFDVTKEDLSELLAPAGEIEDIFLATFEDSGKCKGFGWVRFVEVSGAEAAVKGFLYRDSADGEDEEDSSEAEVGKGKKAKRQKVWLNRLQGRTLRCEFAEDAQTRYKKRFTRAPSDKHSAMNGDHDSAPAGRNEMPKQKSEKRGKDERRDDRRKRHDAKNSSARPPVESQKSTGAIVAGAGKKTTFD